MCLTTVAVVAFIQYFGMSAAILSLFALLGIATDDY